MRAFKRPGIAMAAMIRMIETTINSSINEKPRWKPSLVISILCKVYLEHPSSRSDILRMQCVRNGSLRKGPTVGALPSWKQSSLLQGRISRRSYRRSVKADHAGVVSEVVHVTG